MCANIKLFCFVIESFVCNMRSSDSEVCHSVSFGRVYNVHCTSTLCRCFCATILDDFSMKSVV